MGGIQLLAPHLKDSFIRAYAANGIPTYISLDPNGLILEKSTARPSDKQNLKALFKSVGLLSE